MKIEYTKSGRIKQIIHDKIMINQIKVSDFDDHLINVYLRTEEKIYSLMDYVSLASLTAKTASYKGTIAETEFIIEFIINNQQIDVMIEIVNCKREFDLIYTMDIGLGEEDYLATNPAYASQYLDFNVKNDSPLQIAMRKTIEQASKTPGLITSKMNDIIGYTTDGYQLFTSQYRDASSLDNLQSDLKSEVYQYEFSMLGLQSKKYQNNAKLSFSLLYIDNITSEADWIENVSRTAVEFNRKYEEVNLGGVSKIAGVELTNEQIDQLYKDKKLIEENSQYLSFFVDNTHVVTKQKELLMERNHGHIITSGASLSGELGGISNTIYMNGYFGGQISVGNTTYNQLITPLKNSLNFDKSSGIRMYVLIGTKKYQLTVPSIFEMGINYGKWIYNINNQQLEIKVYTAFSGNVIKYEINSPYKIFVTIKYDQVGDYQQSKLQTGDIDIRPQNDYIKSKCPNLNYQLRGLQKNAEYADGIYEYELIQDSFEIIGNKTNPSEESVNNFEVEVNKFIDKYYEFINGFQIISKHPEINKFNPLITWYVHNALIHYSTPRGLEQYVGAAWGTRDVLQGPFELFLTFQKYDQLKRIILDVYKSQFTNGNWPQWFMFDEYEEVYSHESHGDVVVWPLKALATYLKVTKDKSILLEKVPFKAGKSENNSSDTILNHVKKQWEYIQKNLLAETALPCYGDGDWDDTLQPKKTKQRINMASGWTSALLYEAVNNLFPYLKEVDSDFSQQLESYSNNLKADYFKFLIADDVCAGFILKEQNQFKKLLHPQDNLTGISYRLLPINRGIISGLFSPEIITKSLQVIDKHLLFNDGVRLMNVPASYNHGYNKIFKRAEQASAVGREVGLQYIHAHLRYVEAMAKINQKERTLFALNQVQPIDNDKYVKNTMLKQRNSYFSSSEGNYLTRYDFRNNLAELKAGKIKIKTGWRIYSSGPGIYLNQLIRNVIGIKVNDDILEISPVLAQAFCGTVIKLNAFGKQISFKYQCVGIQMVEIADAKFDVIDAEYGKKVFQIKKSEIEALETSEININISY